jgi:hypothetical protein
MAVDALRSVNWLFWASLAGGTLGAVALVELLGGTTRGYRLFMAFVAAALALLLAVSELALPGHAPAGARRVLSLLFVVGCFAYLAAALAGRPQTVLGLGASLAGVLGAAAFAAADPARLGSPGALLFAAQLVATAVALGAVNAAMLLGHWYLVTPRLSPLPLRRLMWILLGALVVQAIGFGTAFLVEPGDAFSGPIAWLTWLRLLVGIILPIGITAMAIAASRAASLQASTGLLYICLAFVVAGAIAASSITYLAGSPV